MKLTDFGFLGNLNIDDLNAYLAAVQTEIARRSSAPTERVRITISTASYNDRRYTKPWIARITSWGVGGRPDMEFGGFLGRPGTAGELEIMARAGDVIRRGQKDLRGGNTVADWFVVQTDLSLAPVSEPEARAAFYAGAR